MQGVALWSQTAAANANSDPAINWTEGQAPSSINDSARATMASVAKWRDDISGAIVTTGTSVAYAITSNQSFDTMAHFANQLIAFTPHVTNAAGPVTMTVDGFANLPVRTSPGKELPAGVLVQGTPYVAIFNGTDGSLYLQGFYGNPYNVPIGGMLPFMGTSAPNSSFVLPYGQAISRTTYSALFSLVGTAYGVGDGSTTFNVADVRGRVVAGADQMGGVSANRLTSASGMGSGTPTQVGGAETETLTASQIPSITSSVTQTISMALGGLSFPAVAVATNNILNVPVSSAGSLWSPYTASGPTWQQVSSLNSGPISISPTSTNTGGAAHVNVQPTICLNYILRII